MQKDRIKISISTLGCKVNQCDSAAMCESLENSGCELVSFSSRADVHIINTCVVTGKTEAQSRQLIRRALKKNPDSRVVVTGCYPQKSPTDLKALSDRVHVVGNREKRDIDLYLSKILNGSNVVSEVSDILLEKKFTTPAASRFLDRTRAFLKIQDGCNSGCSYCIVPSVRGRSRSLQASEVKSRLYQLTLSGYREIVLTGIHLGAYGLDLTPASSIIELLQSLEEDVQLSRVRIRLSSIEPTEFSDELIRFLSQSKTVCPHFHVPLQSGDGAVLKKMGRPYTPEFFRGLIENLNLSVRDVNIGIDVIAGFPGETDDQFQNTVELIRDLAAGYLHVFPYSQREGTPASNLNNFVPEPVKKQRAQVLRRLSAEKKHSFYLSYQNRVLSVLAEQKRDRETGLLKGFSENYIPVIFDGSNELIGQEVDVKITEVKEDRVYGRIES